jgi:TatD DNase family protein
MTAPALVDSHCHVAEPQFDVDREAVLERAAASGVGTIVCVGATGAIERNLPTLDLAGRREPVRVFATVGIHPHDAQTADDAAFDTLARFATMPGVVGVGETGLDYHYDHSPRETQRAAFARTIALARRLSLPLVVHVREAHEEAADLLRSEGASEIAGVIHCFTGNRDDAFRYLDLGFDISVSGIATFRNADALRDAVRQIPIDSLLVETDAPYLAPIPHRGKRNEPAYVRIVTEAVAAMRGEDFGVVAAATAANAARLFRFPSGAPPST